MSTLLKETRKPTRFQGNRNSINRNQNNKKQLNPDVFVRKATAPEETAPWKADRPIAELPVHPSIIANLHRKGYTSPTEIQDKSIDAVLKGSDLMGLAQTGTGKTGAFLIPLVHRLLGKQPGHQVLVLSPTRELALQIETEFKSITAGLGLYSDCFIGGTDVRRDIQKLRRPCHVIIGTPGRITDMVRQNALNLDRISVLVLDEFDRLLDMGFSTDIMRLAEAMPQRNQTILFSATEDKSQKPLINRLLQNPVIVKLRKENTSGDTIDQEVIRVREGENKMQKLVSMLNDPGFEKVLVFADTKRWVSKICKNLKNAGVKADEIHGNKSQNYRINALDAFRNRKIRVLVATDVAARGLDIDNVTHVINYQAPVNFESYIHRIGRTGRAGKNGKAFTFVSEA
jgi:ATP-dependent RNA helicase RhlE